MCIILIVCMFAIRLIYRFDSIRIREEKVLKQIDATKEFEYKSRPM